MYPYLLIFVAVFAAVICEFGGYLHARGKLKIIFFFLIGYVSLFVGFRDLIGGTDIFIYTRYFLEVPTILELFEKRISFLDIFPFYEPGYFFFNSLCKSIIGGNYYLFFLLVSLLFYYCIYLTLIRFPFFLSSFFVFFSKMFIVSFIYTRQILALAIVWYAFHFLQEKKIKKFLFFLFFASLFHYSAIVVFPIFFLYSKKISNRMLVILFLGGILLGVFPFFNWIMAFLSDLLGYVKLADYSTKDQATFHIFYFLETAILAICLLIKRREIYSDSSKIAIFNMGVLYVLFSFLALKNADAIRFMWYYLLGYIFWVPYFFNVFVKRKRYILLLLALYFFFVYYRNVVVRDDGDFIPYKMFFMDTPHRNYQDYI